MPIRHSMTAFEMIF